MQTKRGGDLVSIHNRDIAKRGDNVRNMIKVRPVLSKTNCRAEARESHENISWRREHVIEGVPIGFGI